MALAQKYPGAPRTGFGDSPELSAELIGLIRAGAKTATCGALPEAGQVLLVADHAGRAVCAYQLTEVTIRRFREVPEDFALAEGEGDFAAWRRGHEAYFARNGGFDPEMELVCERFRVLDWAEEEGT